MKKKLNIGLFGFGCVGSGLYEVLNQSQLLDASITKIVVKDKTKKRTLPLAQFSFDKNEILNNPEINLVVELIDDAEAAYEIVTTAIRKGKHVVSANKKMIANHLSELIELKNQYQVSFLYEAAVCGSIPVIRNLEEYYNNDTLRSVQGICNGTTNYILTRLDREAKSFDEILKDAQDAGFAESDPTSDIDGFDSKFKLQILILHAFGVITRPTDILNLGIRNIKEKDIQFAKEKNLKIKLISKAVKVNQHVVAHVLPEFVEENSFAFDVYNEFNAVSIEALFSDQQLFKGKGAGSFPTASAVLSDISALQFDYGYEYHKKKNNCLKLKKENLIRVFLSSTKQEKLKLIEFTDVEESFQSFDYSYKIGMIESNQLSHELYRNNPELFIAAIGDQTDLLVIEKQNNVQEKELAI